MSPWGFQAVPDKYKIENKMILMRVRAEWIERVLTLQQTASEVTVLKVQTLLISAALLSVRSNARLKPFAIQPFFS
jgi:hypothetical protein